MKEASLWQWLAKLRRTHQPIHIERIENRVGVGVPDVQGCYNGIPFMVELKVAPKPTKPNTPVKIVLRESQREWHSDRLAAGGRSFFLVQVGKTRYLLQWGDWIGQPVRVADLERLSIIGKTARQGEVLRGLTSL